MIGCKEESSKPTAPSIPVGPDWPTSENSNEMGFYSGKGDGEFGAYAGTNNEFQISVPAGDYVLEYTVQNTSANFAQAVTIDGPFYVVFRASAPSVLVIGIFTSVNITSRVRSAFVRYGSLKNFSNSNTWISNSVTLISWPGGGIASWRNAIELDRSRSKVVLIQDGAVASGVKSLPAPSQRVERPAPAPAPRPAPEPQSPTAMPTVTVTPTVTPTTTTCSVAVQTVLGYTNYERCLQGVAPLTQHSQLDAAAQGHSDAMVTQSFFDHTNPYTRTTPSDRITAAGYNWKTCGENR